MEPKTSPEKLRVMIADDEEAARSMLRSLNWASHDCVLVGEAQDGRRVLEMLDACPADILLLDIGMPVISGLQLLPIIAEKHPDTKVILLTMYREFDYALEAMRMKTVDYLIKDVFNPSQLFSAIERARFLLREDLYVQEKKREAELEALRDRDSLSGVPLARVLPARMLRLARGTESGLPLPLEKAEKKILSLPGCGGCFPVTDQDWLFFGCSDERRTEAALAAFWREGFWMTAPIADCPDAKDAAEKGKIYLNEGFYFPERRVLSAGCFDRRMSDAMRADFQTDIRACFYNQDADDDAIDRWMRTFARECVAPEEVKRGLISQIPAGIGNEMDPSELISSLWKADDARSAAALFRGYVLRTRLSGDSRRIEIRRVEAYIRAHLEGDLDVRTLSEQVRLSPNYLSSLFREQTGETLKNHVLRLRMEMAGGLLRGSELKVGEVAHRVGYPNARYFSDAFSKYFGMTPKAFRRGREG